MTTWPQQGVDWRMSDDPVDPCALCVVWVENEDDPYDPERLGYPVWPDGSVVPLIYNAMHDKCYEAAIAYTSEDVA